MIVSPGKAICVALGAALFASAAIAGWRYLPLPTDRMEPESVDVTPVAVQPVIPKTQPPNEITVNVDAPVSVLEEVVLEPARSDSVNTEEKKEAPKGKNHDRQQALLTSMAAQLHGEAYQRFMNQPGFGGGRMLPTISALPREWKMPEWTSEELAKEQPAVKGQKDLELIHRLSLNNFGSSPSKSESERRMEMAKQAHQTKKEQLWEIKSLDLIGLVMHETPVVYVSEKLPAMKDLKKQPTRELDVFESEGLEELMAGKALYIRSKAETVRVLGPVRAAKACLKCHGDAKEGDMLGAFSYTLRPGQYRRIGPGAGVRDINNLLKSSQPTSGKPATLP